MTKTNEMIFNFLILQYPLIHFFPLVPIYVLRAGDIKGKRDMVPTLKEYKAWCGRQRFTQIYVKYNCIKC